MNDHSIMPFGKHKGKSLINVPADYLLWFIDQDWSDAWPELVKYIKDNMPAILSEVKEAAPDIYDDDFGTSDEDLF